MPYEPDINWLEAKALSSKASLGLMSAPGFNGESVERDLLWLGENSVENLIGLVEESEMMMYGVAEVFLRATEMNISYRSVPIINGGIPEDWKALALVNDILALLDEGRKVVLHCIGGFGRTGTIAACCLIARETPSPRAIALVREVRPGAIETKIQEVFIHDFPEYLQRFRSD